MKECASKCYIHHVPCSQRECRLHLDYEEDLNCTDIAVYKIKILFKNSIFANNVRSFAGCLRIKQF